MKTMRKFMMAFIAIATLGLTVACEQDDSEPISGETNGSIVGNWTVDKATCDGSSIITDSLQMYIDVNANGTGAIRFQQIAKDFNWTKNGNTLTITPEGTASSYDYTITLLTATECNFTGTVVPVIGMEGNVSIHMVKDADPTPDPDPEPDPDPDPDPEPNPDPDPDPQPGNFPAATNWTYDYTTPSFNIEYNGMTVPASIQLHMDLAFNADGESGTLVMTGTPAATVYGMTISLDDYAVTENASFTYTYDATTGTGMANGHLPDTASEEVPFSYNSTDNTIVITLPSDIWTVLAANIPEGVDVPLSDLPTNIVFTRVN